MIFFLFCGGTEDNVPTKILQALQQKMMVQEFSRSGMEPLDSSRFIEKSQTSDTNLQAAVSNTEFKRLNKNRFYSPGVKI